MNKTELLFICPVCNRKYEKAGVRVVQEKESGFLIHAFCHFCQNSSLAVYSKNNREREAVAMGMLTDLSYEEACQLKQKKPISADEVLDAYQIIRGKKI